MEIIQAVLLLVVSAARDSCTFRSVYLACLFSDAVSCYVALFKVLSQHLSEDTEINHEELQDSRSLCRDMNPEFPNCEAGVLITRSRLSLFWYGTF